MSRRCNGDVRCAERETGGGAARGAAGPERTAEAAGRRLRVSESRESLLAMPSGSKLDVVNTRAIAREMIEWFADYNGTSAKRKI